MQAGRFPAEVSNAMVRAELSRFDDVQAPFVLDAENLNALHALLSEIGQPIEYQVNCRDGATRNMDIERLRQYDNLPATAIQSIRVWAYNASNGASLMLKMANARPFSGSPVNIMLDGKEPWVVEMNTKLRDRLLHMRPAYARLALMPWWGAFAAYSALVALVLFMLIKWSVIEIVWGKQNQPLTQADIALMLGALVFSVALAFALNYLQSILFPSGVFALGHGVKRQAVMTFWRVGVVAALLVGIIGSMTATLMLR